MGRIIGVDLGTTNTVAAFMEGTQPRVIPNDRSNHLTPSVAAFGSSMDIDALLMTEAPGAFSEQAGFDIAADPRR